MRLEFNEKCNSNVMAGPGHPACIWDRRRCEPEWRFAVFPRQRNFPRSLEMFDMKNTRNAYLRCMCAVYLFAFSSLYVQIPGLYGSDGILPVRAMLNLREKTADECFEEKPTLICYAEPLGLNVEYMMQLIALSGILISFLGVIFQSCCTAIPFAIMWFLYFSLYQVGQVFLWFQWDMLLLEAGFLSIFVAPFSPFHTWVAAPKDSIALWLIRWLLFRLMFASGVVKLSSGCPTWWGLTALKVHFESQCIPTGLSWYFSQLPDWSLKIMVVGTYLIEIGLPFLFFAPIRCLRLLGFYGQVLLQVVIILSGNYNFFNVLTIILCLSLVDDQYFGRGKIVKKTPLPLVSRILRLLLKLLVVAGIAYWSAVLFSLKLQDGKLESAINFTRADFDHFISRSVPISIYFAMLSLSATLAEALTASVMDSRGSTLSRIACTVHTVSYAVIAILLFGISLVPYTVLDQNANRAVWPVLHQWHKRLERVPVANSYGLFRRMTGVGGRPEVIFEGSNNLDGPWKEFHFLYKAGNVSLPPPFVAPHQPRLDWQMWFAALDNYNYNPWLISLSYRLLTAQPEVLALMDQAHNPFPKNPPKYIKASLYHYHYTSWDKQNEKDWWWRERVGEYLPIFSKDHPPLLDYLKNMGILGGAKDVPVYYEWLKDILEFLHHWISKLEASILLWSLLTAACAIVLTRR